MDLRTFVNDVLRDVIARSPRGQFGSDDVRKAINDRYDLGLTPDDDKEITKILEQRKDVRNIVLGSPLWEPGRSAEPKSNEIRRQR